MFVPIGFKELLDLRWIICKSFSENFRFSRVRFAQKKSLHSGDKMIWTLWTDCEKKLLQALGVNLFMTFFDCSHLVNQPKHKKIPSKIYYPFKVNVAVFLCIYYMISLFYILFFIRFRKFSLNKINFWVKVKRKMHGSFEVPG